MLNLTPLVRPYFERIAKRTDSWGASGDDLQIAQLRSLLRRAAGCEVGRRYNFRELSTLKNPYRHYAGRVEPQDFECIREVVMRMIRGERDLLWPGVCNNFAQSSGTSGGKSKYIPITSDSLQRCHYKGAADSVAHYLRHNNHSRLFSGKGMILGGSFANELSIERNGLCVGDLSASLINKINPLVNLFRVPDKKIALMSDWTEKLPALVEKARREDVTNISGVPSWFLTVIKEMLKVCGVDSLYDVWPNLEVFFHGGISFEPYREEYKRLTDPDRMHFLETYNASEGFFAVQNNPGEKGMLLTIDNDIFYEFLPVNALSSNPLPIWEIEKNKVYELLISSSNGLWRYHTGDTVRILSTAPVKILIAGRTKSFINAFGEELMEENAERGMATVCKVTDASVRNYTAAPVFAEGDRRGYHQWLIEWDKAPADEGEFGRLLDMELRKLNSDYDAKRTGDIFLDSLQIVSLPSGSFNRWLHTVGNGKLGGQRKVPRLANDRRIADAILRMLS